MDYVKKALSVSLHTQRLIVNPAMASVVVTKAGPSGPAGIAGGDAANYEHTQALAASSWVINHNLGFKPNVTVEEAGTGQVIMCSEIHHSNWQLELQFNTPRAGTARLS